MPPPDAPYPAAPAWAGAVTRLPKGRQARTVLATGFFLLVLHVEFRGGSLSLQAVTELHPRHMAILRLGALPLAADLHATGEMPQHDGGGCFIDLLTARSGAANEGLFQIILLDAETLHAGAQSAVIGKFGHGRRMNADAGMSNTEWDGRRREVLCLVRMNSGPSFLNHACQSLGTLRPLLRAAAASRSGGHGPAV
jgi:hypothetical protein